MDLHLHPERLAQVRDLHHRRDAPVVEYPRAGDVGRPVHDPFGPRVHLAFGRLRADDRDVQLVGKPDVRRHRMFGHRFLEPGVVQFLEGASDDKGILAGVVMEAVEHQCHVGADCLAHRGADGDVLARIGRAGNRRHARVDLEGLVATRLAGQRVGGVGLRRIKPTGQLIAAHRRGVGQDLVARRPKQLVHRLPECAPGEVPQGQVNRGKDAVGEAPVSALHLHQVMPDLLAVKGIAPHNQWLHHLRDDVG